MQPLENAHIELEKFENLTAKGKRRIPEICDAAAKVFSEKGYLAASLGDIAHVAGLTKGGIFHYFSTKEELLFLILYRYIDSTLQALKRKLEACKTPHDKIYVFIHHHIKNYQDNQAESRLALTERANLPAKFLDLIKALERDYRGILRSLIEPIIRGRKKTPEKITLVTYTLLGMCTLPYTWYNPKGKVTPKELGDLIYEIFVGGLENRSLVLPKRLNQL
jgi:AcrR family transcriptional regulator